MSTHNVEPTWNFYENEGADTVLTQLKAFVSRRTRHKRCKFFYVGQTTDPKRRLGEHQRKLAGETNDLWTHMEVIYGHYAIGAALKVETELIKHAKSIENAKWRDTNWNRQDGTWHPNQVFSVYVLIDEAFDQPPARLHKTCFFSPAIAKARSRDQRNPLVRDAFDKAVCDTSNGKRAQYCYVGITDCPKRRLKEHQSKAKKKYGGGKWNKMHVLCQTKDLHLALEMETMLFEHAIKAFGFNNVMTAQVRALEDGRLPKTYVYLLEERVPRNAPA